MKFSNWTLFVLSAQNRIPLKSPHSGALTSIVDSSVSDAETIAKLEKLPQAVILSLDPLRRSLTHSFLHQSLGSPLDGGATRVGGVTGLDSTSLPLEFDTKSFFGFTATKPTPSLHAFLSTFKSDSSAISSISASTAPSDNAPIGKVCVLPPELTGIMMMNRDASIQDLLHLFIRKIIDAHSSRWIVYDLELEDDVDPRALSVEDILKYAKKTAPTDTSSYICDVMQNVVSIDGSDDDSDEAKADDASSKKHRLGIMKIDFANDYLPMFRTLWAFLQPETDMGSMTVPRSALTENIDWFDRKKEQFLHSPKTASSTLPSPSPQSSSLMSAVHKLCHTLETDRNQRFASDSSDPNKSRKWEKLEETYRKTILFASTQDGVTAPAVPSTRLLSLLQASSAPMISRLFNSWHNNMDMIVQPGMATCIGKGSLVSSPNAFQVNTFSPFFTPPSIAGFNALSNEEEAKMDLAMKNSNLSEQLQDKLTCSAPYVPSDYHILMKQLKNFHAILCDILTDKAVICENLASFIDEIDANELTFITTFRSHKHFSVWILQTIHFKIQSFLHACASAQDIGDLNPHLYTFDMECHSILTQQLNCISAPHWFLLKQEKVEKDVKRPSDEDGGGKYGKKRNVQNRQLDPDLKVEDGKEFYQVTCNYVPTRRLAQLNHVDICNKYHMLGNCHSTCRRASTHRPLPFGILKYYKAQVKEMKEQAKKSDIDPKYDSHQNNTTSSSTKTGTNKK